MAHNMTIDKLGNAEMFYVRSSGTPWHHLGTGINTTVASTSPEMRTVLGWTVDQHAIYWKRPLPDGTFVEELVPSGRLNVRMDTLDQLAIVSPDYHVIQNMEAVAMMDALVGEAAAMYETAGSLKGGRMVWALAALPRELTVVPGDTLKPYLAMMLAHDGTHALTMKPTTTRIVCNNTYDMALGAAGRALRIEHRKGASVKLEEARRILGFADAYFIKLEDAARRLTSHKINALMLSRYFETVFPHPEQATPETREAAARVDALHEKLAILFHEGAGAALPGVKGTIWGALNAVTEYTDHVAPVTVKGAMKAGGLEDVILGSAVQVRQRAMDAALALLPN